MATSKGDESPKEPTPKERNAASTVSDGFTPRQLMEHSQDLLGVPGYLMTVALRRHGDETTEYYSLDEAEALVKKLQSNKVEVE